MKIPLQFTPQKGSTISFEKAQAQASIQDRARKAGKLEYELLDTTAEAGLAALPPPSSGDVFFDIEGDPFVGEHGLEYLFGYTYVNEHGNMQYAGEYPQKHRS